MKNFTLFFTLFFIALVFQANSQTLFDFETPSTSGSFGSWGSAGFAQVPNPDASGINTSANVGQFSHDGSGGYIGIESAGSLENFNFTTTPYFRIKVWVAKPVEVIFKLQNNPNWWENSEQKYQVSENETNKWIELAFNFGAVTATNFNRVVLYFDGGKALSSAGDKYYFDDIQKSNIPPPATMTYSPLNNATDVKVFKNMSITSNFALRMIDDSPITDLSTVVWLKKTSASGEAVPFRGSINTEKTKITITPDQLLEPSTVYFYGINDNVVEVASTQAAVTGASASFTTSSSAPSMVVYNDFETNGTSLCTLVETMGDPAPPFSLVEDPAGAGNQVLKFEKNSSWSGWNRVHLVLEKPMDFTNGSVFSMRIYSPVTTWVRLKIGNQKDDGGNFKEKDADVTLVNGWQTLYFDYANDNITSTDYTHISIYVGGGNGTPNNFYIDDFKGVALASSAVFTYDPEDNATGVKIFSKLTISSNFAMRMIDDSPITDLSSVVWLKKTSASGTAVPFTGSINADKTKITISPNQLLDPSTVYFYGIIDNTVEISSTQAAVTNVSASFTTGVAPTLVVYNDFETAGTSLCKVVETMGDPAPPFSIVADPAGAGNQVLKFEKNNSWSGWSRVHLELDRPIDMSGDHVYSMRVYSPVTTWVRLKIGNQKEDGGSNKEKDADVTMVNGWQTLYFDYSAENITATDYTHISIYFGGGDATPNNFYIDDFKGAILTSGVGLNEFDKTEFRVYPNPAKDYLYISNISELKRIDIYTIAGQKVKTFEILDNKIQITELPQGIYLISAENYSGEILSSKFFKK